MPTSASQRVVQPNSPGHIKPGHDIVSLSMRQSHGSSRGGHSRSHIAWAEERPIGVPSGPPHKGTRDELVRENRELFKALQSAQVETYNAAAEAGALRSGASSAMARAGTEKLNLETQIAALYEELTETRKSAESEKASLQVALDVCRTELQQCSERLARTHAALGLTSERARVLETSKGRLQIDLDGTLSTLEVATKRHAAQEVQAEKARAKREAELLEQLSEAEQRAHTAEAKAEVNKKRAARLESELAAAQQAYQTDRLRLGHELERFADRLAAAEANQLDPTRIVNIAFAQALSHGTPSRPTASVPTTLLRGRLQSMVPPTMMASPAPI